MRLPKPFFRLPLRFDAARLAAEVAALPAAAWAEHPNHLAGNSCVRLISVDGGENDSVDGPMAATAHLARLPYVQQLLAGFGVVWSRSRLMRLAPGADVPEHADINHHWFYRVRLHVPVVTRPAVRFHCDGEAVHMAAGEAWLFDNWRLHRVENPTPHERIHLVADTTGSAQFWNLARHAGLTPDTVPQFDAARPLPLLLEQAERPAVMPPAEVDLLLGDLCAELVSIATPEPDEARVRALVALLSDFRRDWRQLHALLGEGEAGRPRFVALRDRLRETARPAAAGLAMRTNRVGAMQVLEARLLQALLREERRGTAPSSAPASAAAPIPVLQHPLLLIAAPRSGSTLLFETLAASTRVATVGGESHELIEGLPELRPGAPGVNSNRLEARQATPGCISQLRERFAAALVDAAGRPLGASPTARLETLRLVEKTPKNALRIPFLERVFPDARFVFLWRDPRENLASIVRAWQSGRWKTYNGLAGFDGPWSLALPPGWRALSGRPLIEIAAFQWQAVNQVALQDLRALDPARWVAVEYRTLVAQPRLVIERLAAFGGLLQADGTLDAGLAHRLAAPLPASRQTLAPADPDKWRELESEIDSVLPALLATWQELRALPPLF